MLTRFAADSGLGGRAPRVWNDRAGEVGLGLPVDGCPVRVKLSGDGVGRPIAQATAEFADIEALAAALGIPQRVALARAEAEAWSLGLRPGAPWPDGDDD